MTKQNLEINIFYASRGGREITFTDIANSSDCMDLEDYEAEAFWMLTGGFQVTLDGYKTIFRSSDFHYLVKATSFLIHSLYWIKNKTSDWFDKDDTFPNDVIVKSTGGNLVRLQSINDDELKFSHTPPNEKHLVKRGDRFFAGAIIHKKEWFIQTNVALKEYFDTLSFVVDKSEKSKTSEVMIEYYEVWKAISKDD
jgi:hypothetical protein